MKAVLALVLVVAIGCAAPDWAPKTGDTYRELAVKMRGDADKITVASDGGTYAYWYGLGTNVYLRAKFPKGWLEGVTFTEGGRVIHNIEPVRAIEIYENSRAYER